MGEPDCEKLLCVWYPNHVLVGWETKDLVTSQLRKADGCVGGLVFLVQGNALPE